MKPSWDEAPEWANWLAMDRSGDWFWYAVEPDCDNIHGWWNTKLKNEFAALNTNWRETLERRPT